jgi:hypothetical protein
MIKRRTTSREKEPDLRRATITEAGLCKPSRTELIGVVYRLEEVGQIADQVVERSEPALDVRELEWLCCHLSSQTAKLQPQRTRLV